MELFRLVLLVLALVAAIVGSLSLSLSLPSRWAVAAGLLVASALAFWFLRYLGNLSRIMEVAAWSDEGASRLRRDMALGMQNADAYEQLIELYEPIRKEANRTLGTLRELKPVVRRSDKGEDHRYATVAITAADGDTLESLFMDEISKRDHIRFRRLADSRQRLMRKWREMEKNQQRKIEDELGDNYCLSKLRIDRAAPNGGLRMEVGVATYGEIMRSCDGLINEFALFGYLTGTSASRRRPSVRQRRLLRMSPAAMLRCLPWRHRVHRDARARPRDIRRHRWLYPSRPAPAGRLFLRPEDRAAGVGVAVVTVEKKKKSERVFLGMRSGVVGTYPSTNHVVPAGMCNTYGTDLSARSNKAPPPAYYLSTAMKCEFIEEWFSVKAFEDNKRQGWKDLVDDYWEKEMRTKAKKWGDPELTGVAFDLLNLRPEVCAVAVVQAKRGVLNWEFDAIGFEGSLSSSATLRPTEIVQSGAAALWLLEQKSQNPPELRGCKRTGWPWTR